MHRKEAQQDECIIQNALAYYDKCKDTPHGVSLRATAKLFGCSRTTLTARHQGRLSKLESADARAFVTHAQSIEICNFLSQIADQGFPDTQRRLQQRLTKVARMNLGDPTFVLHKNYVDRWADRYSNLLSKYWTTSLTTVRANALNETAVSQYFGLLAEADATYKFKDENIYSMDETNMSFGCAGKSWVFGQKGKRSQAAVRDGSREGATVVTCICADGSTLTPTVIFKGKNFTGEKAYKNPLDAAYVIDLWAITLLTTQ